MKIIGIVRDRQYLCEVGHTELEKFLGLYYGKMQRLKVGDDVNLGQGHDYAGQIEDAMKKTREFVEGNKNIVKAILNGLTITGPGGAA